MAGLHELSYCKGAPWPYNGKRTSLTAFDEIFAPPDCERRTALALRMSGATAGRTRERIVARNRTDVEQWRDDGDDREKFSYGNSGGDAGNRAQQDQTLIAASKQAYDTGISLYQAGNIRRHAKILIARLIFF